MGAIITSPDADFSAASLGGLLFPTPVGLTDLYWFGGDLATSRANMAVGAVSHSTLSSGGTGYLTAPSVTFSAAPTGGRTATGVAVLSGDAVVRIDMTDAGLGYVTPPTVSFSGGGGSGAAATAVISSSNLVTVGTPTINSVDVTTEVTANTDYFTLSHPLPPIYTAIAIAKAPRNGTYNASTQFGEAIWSSSATALYRANSDTSVRIFGVSGDGFADIQQLNINNTKHGLYIVRANQSTIQLTQGFDGVLSSSRAYTSNRVNTPETVNLRIGSSSLGAGDQHSTLAMFAVLNRYVSDAEVGLIYNRLREAAERRGITTL